MRFLSFLVFVCLTLGLSGCGGATSAGGKYRVSGAMLYDGKPVPAGRIYFSPDMKQGGTGQQGFAEIKSGKYDTASGQGTDGGAVIIRIEANDASGKLAWTYELAGETLPQEATTRNFDIAPGQVQKVAAGVPLP